MAAVAPAFDACGVRIAQDAVKGKVVYSERAIAAGEVIFSEQAFVFAPWSTNVCDGCEADKSDEPAVGACACGSDKTSTKKMYSKLLTKDVAKRHAIVQLMAEVESIGEVDRARCVLKCLAMVEHDSTALEPILSLTCANFDQCLEDATELLEHAPEILPEGFSVDQLATLIGVLNTNSHELENLGGSGLFLSACRMEHNCSPNCSFTTYDATLWMTAIRPIAKGEPLSIDYGNFFYRPTQERLTSLLESYGFLCSCDACLKQPDTCRAFKCPAAACSGKTDSAIHPHPRTPTAPLEDPDELTFDWTCSVCGYVPSETEKDAFEAAEQSLLENGFPETLQEVDAFIKTTPLHERHYLLFWALDAIGCEAAALVSFLAEAKQRVDLADVWTRIIASMNIVIPHAHHEKTIYYDNLAQVQVVLGDLEAAKRAYCEAYEIACVVSGPACAPTQKLLELAQNPPANAEELRKVYANVKRREARDDEEEEDGDDEEEWEDEEDEEEEA